MQLFWIIGIAFALFVIFTIELNVGLHGIMNIYDIDTPAKLLRFHRTKYNNMIDESPSNKFNNLKQNQQLLSHLPIDNNILPPISLTESDINDNDNKETLLTKESISSYEVDNHNHFNFKYINKYPVDNLINSVLASDGNEYHQSLIEAYDHVTAHAHAPPESDSDSDHSITEYLKLGKKFPILLLTCNRPQLLELTIQSLLSVRGVTKSDILVSQDGTSEEVSNIISKYSLTFIQNTNRLNNNLRGGAPPDGAQRIAMHYKFSLTSLFKLKPTVPAVIIVEDDLLFSPDFYEYFSTASPVLELDPTVLSVSAWNDNGFKGKVNNVHCLQRTDFFPGLGWLLSRDLYVNELEMKWPTEHWDHWLRSYDVNRGREIVHPEVPRSYHNGIKGTFMNIDMHNKYFRDIDYNKNTSFTWNSYMDEKNQVPLYTHALKQPYETRITQLISKCKHASSAIEVVTLSGIVCVWINIDPEESNNGHPEFEHISNFFGIWHEHKRGAHSGLHEFYWDQGGGSKYILLLNTYSTHKGTYKHLMPRTATVLSPVQFNKDVLKYSAKVINFDFQTIPASSAGMNCNEVCAENSKTCSEDALATLNSCNSLTAKFPCVGECLASMGGDQPAYVDPKARIEYNPGRCVYNSDPRLSTCSASHEATVRLCACI